MFLDIRKTLKTLIKVFYQKLKWIFWRPSQHQRKKLIIYLESAWPKLPNVMLSEIFIFNHYVPLKAEFCISGRILPRLISFHLKQQTQKIIINLVLARFKLFLWMEFHLNPSFCLSAVRWQSVSLIYIPENAQGIKNS